MSVLLHYKNLAEKHDKLDQIIRSAYTHHEPDEKIRSLKVERLKIKEELSQLEKSIRGESQKVA